MKRSTKKSAFAAVLLATTPNLIPLASAFPFFSNNDRPAPDEAMIRSMRHPIAQGVRVKVVVTHYLNSVSCVGQWSNLNRFNNAFAMDSQTLLDRDSTDNRFQLGMLVDMWHEDRAQIARGRRFPDTLLMDGEVWNTFQRQDIEVRPLVSLQEQQGALHVDVRPAEWVEVRMNEPRRQGPGLVLQFDTPVAIDAIGHIRVQLGTANRGPYVEGRTPFSEIARTLLGRIDVPYDLTRAAPATESRIGGLVTTTFTAQPGSPNPCLQGWVQIAAQHTR